MSLKALQARLTRLSSRIDPAPQLIDCTGVKEELLAMLSSQIEKEEPCTPYTPCTEEDEKAFSELDAMLQASIDAIEKNYNVKFV